MLLQGLHHLRLSVGEARARLTEQGGGDLGRHVAELGALYQRGIEHTVLAQYLLDFLSHTQDAGLGEATAGLDAAARQALTTTVAARLHATVQFETTEDRNLRVVIDDSVVREAFLTLGESRR